ncbi:basic helix-loop-helix transcription factor [Lithospermum erythrorhizon]|uniref:Basic helix-loop-helix transcription factor n=1 Tax=Lithospermum erythrorhizon TaxID=34254 RepID=A0AAV3P1I7_LITER
MHQPSSFDAYMSASSMVPHEISPILPWTLSSSPHHGFNQIDPFPLPPPPPPPSSYVGLFNRRQSGFQFGYEGISSDHHLSLISDTLGQVIHQPGGVLANPFCLHDGFEKMSAQEIMDAKALAASKSHSEAERRRRERINNHLNKLRSILPNTTKTDKASLLAEVIQHVKELRKQASIIAETCAIPAEIDELTVENEPANEDGNNKFVIKASLCCEDRADLLQDLIKTLKALKLRTIKAEITTLGGRVKNVLFITSEDDDLNNNNNGEDQEHQQLQYCINSIQEALKAVIEKSSGDEGNVKRQRTNLKSLN